MSKFKAKIEAILDTKKIPSQIAAIEKSTITFKNLKINKFDIDTSAIVSQVQSTLSKHKFTVSINGIDTNNITKTVKQMTDSVEQQFNRINRQLSNGGVDAAIARVNARYIELKDTGHKSLSQISSDIERLEDLQRQMNDNISSPTKLIASYAEYANVLSQVRNQLSIVNSESKKTTISDSGARVAASVSKQLQSIQKQIASDGISSAISSMEQKYSKLLSTGHKRLETINADLSSLKMLQKEMSSSDIAQDDLLKAYNEYSDTLKRVKNNLSIVASESKSTISSLQVGKLDNSMTTWLDKNSRAADRFGSSIDDLRSRLQSLFNNGGLNQAAFDSIKNEFIEIQQAATRAGLLGETFGARLSNTFSNVVRYFGTSQIFSRTERILRQMAQNVIDVDTAMTGLYRVTDLTDQQYKEMYSNMVQSAKQYGTELTDIIDSTANWVKLGFDENVSQQLAGITSMYQHVTDLDTKTAVNNLVTAYKGFEDQLLELTSGDIVAAVEYIADIYDNLGNKFAVSASDVGDSLKRSASALQIAGNTIEQSAAMAVGITEVTQDASKAGNALRVLSMRLRGTTAEELQSIGEDVDGLITVTSKLQDTIYGLTGVSLIDENTGDLRSTYEVLRDLAAVWDTLSTNAQSNVLETIAGKNRGSDIAALIKNWSQVEKAYTAAITSSGTASQEQEKWVQSLEARIKKLTTAWQALSNTVMDSGFLQFFIDAGTTILEILDTLIGNVGTIPTLIGTAFAGLSLFKDVGELINQFQFLTILRIEYAHEAYN